MGGERKPTQSRLARGGALAAGRALAAVVVALILLAGVCYLVAKEKAGKPLFTNLDGPDSKA